jgi:hypothetical protein
MNITRSRWRIAAAVALLAAGAVHIPITGEHLEEAPYMGALFIALTVACGICAILLVLRDNPLVWMVAGGVAALAVIGYVLSRTVGLPQIDDDVGNWSDPLGTVALVTEGLTVVMAALALRLRTTNDAT